MNDDINKNHRKSASRDHIVNDDKEQQRLDVERAVGEGMDTPMPPKRPRDLREEAAKLWQELAALLKDRPSRVLAVVASVSFFAGVLAGRFGRTHG